MHHFKWVRYLKEPSPTSFLYVFNNNLTVKTYGKGSKKGF